MDGGGERAFRAKESEWSGFSKARKGSRSCSPISSQPVLALSFTKRQEASDEEGGLTSFSIEMLTERFIRSRARPQKVRRASPKAVEKLY